MLDITGYNKGQFYRITEDEFREFAYTIGIPFDECLVYYNIVLSIFMAAYMGYEFDPLAATKKIATEVKKHEKDLRTASSFSARHPNQCVGDNGHTGPDDADTPSNAGKVHGSEF